MQLIALLAIINRMKTKHIKILCAIFAKPTTRTLPWSDIESLLLAAGCRVIEGNGSRVRFVSGDCVATFHRPNPTKEAKAYQVEDARKFLDLIGVKP
ncbi:type II toxin-antitoxin system HicA family toxin [Propionivibrio sp.]|uniref:type II toxin-antitoxin system HicA family toxin n=1 Tax=Propionivibrio sp. TaxID=2212460 RepID=UPI003BEF8590